MFLKLRRLQRILIFSSLDDSVTLASVGLSVFLPILFAFVTEDLTPTYLLNRIVRLSMSSLLRSHDSARLDSGIWCTINFSLSPFLPKQYQPSSKWLSLTTNNPYAGLHLDLPGRTFSSCLASSFNFVKPLTFSANLSILLDRFSFIEFSLHVLSIILHASLDLS